MVVVAILSMLMSLILVATLGQRKEAAEKATRALIQRIEVALQKYHDLTGSYPPDGLDSVVETEDGTEIRGSACLYYFLSRPIDVVTEVAGEQRRSKHDPLMEFRKNTELREDPDHPGVYEIVDGFGEALHYDNTENGRFEPQDGSAHMPEVEDHPPDPRESVEFGAVKKVGIQGQGYDIWSHGVKRHTEHEDLSGTIGSWKLGTGS